MKKLLMFVLFAFCATLISHPISASEKDNLNGTWAYKVPSAPYEYSQGKLIFGETNGMKTVTIKFTSGVELKAQNVKIEKETISFSVLIEGNYVKFTGKLAEGKITGKVDSPEGLLELTAEKQQ